MRIGLITIHHANSYGGNLQALASQTVLSRYGCVKIIDYKTKHLASTMKLFRGGRDVRAALRVAKDIARLVPRYRLLKSFKRFGNDYFQLTRACSSFKELEDLQSEFDFFVSGSDQIWNPNILSGLDPAYFLGFAGEKQRISLASSAGSYRYDSIEKADVKKYLQAYKSISVRESDTADYLSSLLGGRKIECVLDPTLLLNKSEWSNLLDLKNAQSQYGDYALIYTLKKDISVRRLIARIRKETGLKIVAIDQDPYLGYPTDAHLNDICPRRFVELFLGAKLVITNSFHGTAFAANFGKPFFVTKPETGANRIITLLKSLGLEDRYLDSDVALDGVCGDLYRQPLCDSVQEKLKLLRSATFEYIDRAFS